MIGSIVHNSEDAVASQMIGIFGAFQALISDTSACNFGGRNRNTENFGEHILLGKMYKNQGIFHPEHDSCVTAQHSSALSQKTNLFRFTNALEGSHPRLYVKDRYHAFQAHLFIPPPLSLHFNLLLRHPLAPGRPDQLLSNLQQGPYR